MKNVSMTINPNAINSLTPPAYPSPPQPIVKISSVSFSVQFDNEIDAIEFAKVMLEHINEFNIGGE